MNTVRPLGTLGVSEEAFELLQDLQKSRGSHSDPASIEALQAALKKMEDLLQDQTISAGRLYYLSSLDPGKGKTEAVCQFLKAWKSRGFPGMSGVLIALSRREEIRSYIKRAGLSHADYAVLVERTHDLNGWGRARRDTAPVLFTTQAMIRSRCRHRDSFEKLTQFHYLGRPRSCRIWDETMVPAEPVALRLDTLLRLLEPLRPVAPSIAERLATFIAEADNAAAGSEITAPMAFAEVRDITVLEGELKDRWATLRVLADQKLIVTKSNLYGVELVASQDALPEDFAPALILDASGRVRETYRVWEATSGDLVRLPSATNDYSNLTVHHWHEAASRSALIEPNHRDRVLKKVAELIDASPSEEWLVVHHMAKGDLDIERELRGRIEGDSSRLSFLHWGNHHGTNAYRHIEKVIVLGPWSYPKSLYLGQFLASGGDSVASSTQRDPPVQRIREGEHRHNLLQAICRTSVRNSSKGHCGKCEVYVIGKLGARGTALLTETFPGCEVLRWAPEGEVLRGQAKKLADELSERLRKPSVVSVSKAELGNAIGLKGSKGLAQVLKRPDVKRWMTVRGFHVTTREVVRQAA